MSTLFRAHSDLRWLVVLVGLVLLVRLAIGLAQRQPYDKLARYLMLGFTTLVDIQVLLGLIYFIWNGIDASYWPRQRFEHLVIMLVAAGIAHLPRRWAEAPSLIRYRNNLLVVTATLVMIFVGVIVLIGGMDRWAFDM